MSLKKINVISKKVSVTRLRESVVYDAETGIFTWVHRPEKHFKDSAAAARWNGKYPGRRAFTSKCPRGYLRGMLDGKTLYAHRAAVALSEGQWPWGEVDHINRDKSDNRLPNLRIVTHRQNRMNSKDCDRKAARELSKAKAPARSRKIPGIRRGGKSSWSVRVKRGGVERHIGTFRCFGAAVKARGASV